jgi:COMPASS component SWD3
MDIDPSIFYYGTSRKVLAMVDIRTDGTASVIRNDSMINTLYSSRDGIHVITGDAHGMLKVWDIRSSKLISWGAFVLFVFTKYIHFIKEQCISSKSNDPGKMPITHISIGRRSTDASRRAGMGNE